LFWRRSTKEVLHARKTGTLPLDCGLATSEVLPEVFPKVT